MDANSLPLIVLGVCLLCVVGVILFFGLQFLGVILDVVSALMDLLNGAFGGQGCCGCLVLVGGCGVIAAVGYLGWSALQSCGTPQATNFCTLLGR